MPDASHLPRDLSAGGLLYRKLASYTCGMRRRAGELLPIEQAILAGGIELAGRSIDNGIEWGGGAINGVLDFGRRVAGGGVGKGIGVPKWASS